MTDYVKVSALTYGGPADGQEVVPVLKDGRTKYLLAQDISALAESFSNQLRDDLSTASEGFGVDLVRGAIKFVEDLSAAQGLTSETTADVIFIGGADGGFFRRKRSDTTSAENGNGACGTIIRSADYSENGIWERVYSGAVSVVWFGAKGDGATDDVLRIEAAELFCRTNKVDLFVPRPVSYYRVTRKFSISGTGWSFIGEGSGTIFGADDFTGPVIEINTSAWSTDRLKVGGFTVQNRNSAVFPGQTGVKGAYPNGLELEPIVSRYFEYGYDFEGAQFCDFHQLVARDCAVGCFHHQDAIGGGGNNVTYYDPKFSYNGVGMFIQKTSSFPLHDIKIINPTTHVNSVCGIAVSEAVGVSIEQWAPEQNGGGASTQVINGFTVKNSTLHAYASQVTCPDYSHVSLTQYIIAEAISQVMLPAAAAGGFLRTQVDSTSLVSFQSDVGQVYGYAECVSPPAFVPGGIIAAFLSEPVLHESRQFTNEATGDVVRGQFAGGTTGTTSYTADPDLGSIATVSFASLAQQAVLNTASASYVNVANCIYASLLVRASADGLYRFSFAQSTVTYDASLRAGKLYRLSMFGRMAATPRTANIIITPQNAGAVGASLSACRLHALSLGDFSTFDRARLAALSRDGVFNPNTQHRDLITSNVGDADISLNILSSANVQKYTSPITADRTVTLPTFSTTTVGSSAGAEYIVIRTAAATGAFTVSVGGLKLLSAGEWARVAHDGSGWVLVGSGTL